MKGRYLYSHCGELGLNVTCNIRNSSRGKADESGEMWTALRVFCDGELVFENADFSAVQFGGNKRLELDALGFDFQKDKNYLVVLDSVKGDAGDAGYFAQEHQIIYRTSGGQRASLLYDHQPAFPRNGKYSTVIVLAPKVLVSKTLNTFLIFSAYREENDYNVQQEPLLLKIFDQTGKLILEHLEKIKLNAPYIFDVKKHLKDFQLTDQPAFLNLAAKAGEAAYSIVTIIKNEQSGNIGLEHSLPPDYYVSGEKSRIRKEALVAA